MASGENSSGILQSGSMFAAAIVKSVLSIVGLFLERGDKSKFIDPYVRVYRSLPELDNSVSIHGNR